MNRRRYIVSIMAAAALIGGRLPAAAKKPLVLDEPDNFDAHQRIAAAAGNLPHDPAVIFLAKRNPSGLKAGDKISCGETIYKVEADPDHADQFRAKPYRARNS